MLKSIFDQIRDYTPVTPPEVLEEFLSSSIHTDFINELAIRIEQMRDYNEICGSKEYLETRGGIKVLRLISEIFNDMAHNSRTDMLQSTNEKEGKE